MAVAKTSLLLLAAAVASLAAAATASGAALPGETCAASSPAPCGAGMRCASCSPLLGPWPAVCSRTTPVDPKAHGTGLPFNKYAWLTTHNSYAVTGAVSPTGSNIVSPPNQEDTVTDQLKMDNNLTRGQGPFQFLTISGSWSGYIGGFPINGVRGLMLDTYDYKNDVWLCHTFGGKCYEFTAFQPALKVLNEVKAFLESNPSEVITIFLEDYTAPGSLAKVLSAAGLTKYMFPVANMPKNGGDWPLVKDMIAQNHRLLLFTSQQGMEASDGIAHQWNYVVETQYGNDGMVSGACPKRPDSQPMDSMGQSLVLLNFFMSNPSQLWACGNNSAPLVSKLKACYDASAKRWPNFIAVDFYMRSTGGGAPLATDAANGRLQCGCDSIAYCKANAPFGTCDMPLLPTPPPSPPSLQSLLSHLPFATPSPSQSPLPPQPTSPTTEAVQFGAATQAGISRWSVFVALASMVLVSLS